MGRARSIHGEVRNAYKGFNIWEDNIKIEFEGMKCEGGDRIHVNFLGVTILASLICFDTAQFLGVSTIQNIQ